MLRYCRRIFSSPELGCISRYSQGAEVLPRRLSSKVVRANIVAQYPSSWDTDWSNCRILRAQASRMGSPLVVGCISRRHFLRIRESNILRTDPFSVTGTTAPTYSQDGNEFKLCTSEHSHERAVFLSIVPYFLRKEHTDGKVTNTIDHGMDSTLKT